MLLLLHSFRHFFLKINYWSPSGSVLLLLLLPGPRPPLASVLRFAPQRERPRRRPARVLARVHHMERDG